MHLLLTWHKPYAYNRNLGGLRTRIRKRHGYYQQDSKFSKPKLWNGLQTGGSERSDPKKNFSRFLTVYREIVVQIQPEHLSLLCTISLKRSHYPVIINDTSWARRKKHDVKHSLPRSRREHLVRGHHGTTQNCFHCRKNSEILWKPWTYPS
jgi:hypothetical protein